MTPAAVLSILVKTQGIRGAQAELTGLHKSATVASTGLDTTEKTTSKAGRALGAFGRTAGLIAGAAGVGGTVVAVQKMNEEYREAQKVTAQTNAVLRSTRGVANISAEGVGNLANAISRKTAIDDEQIQSGANLLLTFKNIRNEVGAGRDIFNQATQAAVDLSAAGFGSLSSTSKQLGKALNDPVKGMTALGRAGVTFSQKQKDAIEKLLATGKAADRVKAQQLILREVMSQVGGSAAAQATAGDKLRVAFDNLAESGGRLLIPTLDKATAGLAEFFNQILEHRGIGGALVTGFQAAGRAIDQAAAAIRSARPTLEDIGAVTARVGEFFQRHFGGIAIQAVTAFGKAMVQIIQGVILVLRGLVDFIGGVFTGDWSRAWKGITEIFGGAWKAIAGILRSALNTLSTILKVGLASLGVILSAAWTVIRNNATTAWRAIGSAITAPIKAAADLLGIIAHGIATALATTWRGIRDVTRTVWGAIRTALTTPINAAARTLGVVLSGLRTAFDTVFGAAKTVIQPVVDLVEKLVSLARRAEDLPIVGGLLGSGGKGNGKTVGPEFANLRGLSSLQQVADASIQFGLSGGRGPGQAFRPGDDGWHGQNRARDLSGPPAAMLGYARLLASTIQGRLLELIHTPLGFGIKNGKLVPNSFWGQDVLRDHFDHVHVAMAKGGTMDRTAYALVGEEGPEIVKLPKGAHVTPHKQSMAMIASAERYSNTDLQKLWAKAGGDVDKRALMAAIALAESRGNPKIVNSIGAGGLWQIHPPEPNYLDPLTNAKIAVRKLHTQGLKAWEAYTNGSYKRFLAQPISDAVAEKERPKLKRLGEVVGRAASAIGPVTTMLQRGWAQATRWLTGDMPDVFGEDGFGDKLKLNSDALRQLATGEGIDPRSNSFIGGYALPPVVAKWALRKQDAGMGNQPEWFQQGAAAGFAAAHSSRIWSRAGKPIDRKPLPRPLEDWGEIIKRMPEFGQEFIDRGQFLRRTMPVVPDITKGPEAAPGPYESIPSKLRGHWATADDIGKRIPIGDFIRTIATGTWVPGNVPYVGEFGTGGVVPRTGVAMVHKGETITPAGGATTVVEHHYHGPVVQDAAFVKYIKDQLAQDARRNG